MPAARNQAWTSFLFLFSLICFFFFRPGKLHINKSCVSANPLVLHCHCTTLLTPFSCYCHQSSILFPLSSTSQFQFFFVSIPF